jgi:hypothetical protein
MNEQEMTKALAAEIVKALETNQENAMKAVGARLSEVHVTLNRLGASLESLAFLLPIQHTAHLAMEALIKSMRGPHEAEELADTAWKIAEKMHARAQATLKFGGIASAAPESTHVEEPEASAPEAKTGSGSALSPSAGNDVATLRVAG